MADQFEMTQKGYEEAVARLKYLQTEKRQEVVERIQEARSHGDLSENAEYDAARNEQSAVEGEIAELEYKVKNAKIIEENTDNSYIHIGCTVRVYDEEEQEEVEYTITAPMEADYSCRRISNASPVGEALMKHKVGDTVEVDAPNGSYNLKVLEIYVK